MLTPKQIAADCQLNYRTVLRAIEAGELPASRLRGQLRVSEEDFAEWVGNNRVEPDAEVPVFNLTSRWRQDDRGLIKLP